MNIRDLIQFGVDSSLIDVWRSSGHQTLLPVQQMAVQRYGVLRGENLIVTAPTSSGKTFVGEMAAGHTLMQGRKCLYLAPLKALAAEKFETFRARYAPLGARVVVSTRDYRQYDSAIERQEFDIAVVVYEKMRQLLARGPGVIRSVGLVVADELQTLADPGRGAGIEVLLTQLKLSKEPFQLVGLSAVIRNSDVLSRWLNARFLEHWERPVELRRGILYDGVFHYETYNTRAPGTETLVGEQGDPAWRTIMANAVHLASGGEQSLVFLSDKRTTRRMALLAAEEFQASPADRAVDELMALEETHSRHMLVECLQSGIAFHNADMSLHERRVVERHFRNGSIRIICATSTLAVGINLPVRNVFIEPMAWERHRLTGRMHKRPITKAEYENMSGRAGRLSLEDEFGRSILVAAGELEWRALRKQYLEAEVEDLEPQLVGVDLETHVLHLATAGAAATEGEIATFLAGTLTGIVHARALSQSREAFKARVSTAVENCVRFGLFTRTNGRLRTTTLGRLCAIKGIVVRTGCELRAWLASLAGRRIKEPEAIYALCRTVEVREQHINLSREEYHAWLYPDQLAGLLPPQAIEFFGPVLSNRIHQTYEEVKAMKMALVLCDWVQGRQAIEIEDQFSSLAGMIRSAGETCGWLADVAASVAELLTFPKGQVEFLEGLAVRLIHGVPVDGVPLCRFKARGIGRVQIQRLLSEGLRTPEAVEDASLSALQKAVGAGLAAKIRDTTSSGDGRRAGPGHRTAADSRPNDAEREAGGTRDDEFACHARFHFDASPHRRRTVLVVNGARHPIPNKAFAIALRMAIQLQIDGKGWVHKSEFGGSAQQFISNTRRDLRTIPALAGVPLVENDSYGSYRMSVPPECLSVDWSRVEEHWDAQIAKLARLAPSPTP